MSSLTAQRPSKPPGCRNKAPRCCFAREARARSRRRSLAQGTKRTSAGAAGGGFSSCLAKQASAARRWRRADLVRSTIPRIETPRGPAGGVAGQCWTEQTTGSRPAAIAGHHRPPRAGTVRFSLTRASRRVGACRGLFRRGLPGSGPATLPPGLGSDLQRVKGASPPASRHRGRRRRSQRRGGRGHPRSVAEE
jgi:hypothetical protein